MSREAQVVELHFYAGATHAEIAESLGISERQAYRDDRHARAWLKRRLNAKSE